MLSMKNLYLDIFSGISGDMFIGAMLDLGVEFRSFEAELQKLKLDGYHLHLARKQKSGIEGAKFDVHIEAEHSHAPAAQKKNYFAPMSTGHTHSHSHGD